MIRVTKSINEPLSLQTTKSYKGQDVRRQIRADHKSICYLCDRERDTDFEIEHLKSRTHHPLLETTWSNLFFSCSYCNNKKSDNFDDILNPLDNDIEDIICQEMDLENNVVKFSCVGETSVEIDQCIKLLSIIHNGRIFGLRDKDNEEVFYESIRAKYNSFITLITSYVFTPTEELKLSVIKSLSLGQEILGLKYWVIKSNPALFSEFGECIKWNKQ